MSAVDPSVYQQMLDDLQSATGDSTIAFLKDGKSKLRLIADDPERFFAPCTRSFTQNGKTTNRQRYIFKALILDEGVVKGVVVAKVVLRSILSLLAEGYDLFSEQGHGIVIQRSGKGLETQYTVVPSPRPVPIPGDVDMLEISLEDLAARVTAMDSRRSQMAGGGAVREDSLGDGEEVADW